MTDQETRKAMLKAIIARLKEEHPLLAYQDIVNAGLALHERLLKSKEVPVGTISGGYKKVAQHRWEAVAQGTTEHKTYPKEATKVVKDIMSSGHEGVKKEIQKIISKHGNTPEVHQQIVDQLHNSLPKLGFVLKSLFCRGKKLQ